MGIVDILDPIFNPLLKLSSFWVIFILSVIINLIITLIQKYATNQNRLKEIKEETKSIKKKISETSDPQEKMRLNKETMKLVPEQMKHSMRSMMFTIIPIIFIFGWMNANIAFDPITPGSEFDVILTFDKDVTGEVDLIAPIGIEILGKSTQEIMKVERDGFFSNKLINEAKWSLKGNEGDYIDDNSLQFKYNKEVHFKDVIITTEQRYSNVRKAKKTLFSTDYIQDNSKLNQIEIKNEPMIVFFGLTWFWSYIIISIVLSIVMRKIIKVY